MQPNFVILLVATRWQCFTTYFKILLLLLLVLAESSGKEPDWNFWKYLIDVNGRVVDAWGPKVSVKEIRPKIAELVRQIILKKKEEL